MFANGPRDRGSIPGRVMPETKRMELDGALLNAQHHKVGIKGKVMQSRERSGVVVIEKWAFVFPTYFLQHNIIYPKGYNYIFTHNA